MPLAVPTQWKAARSRSGVAAMLLYDEAVDQLLAQHHVAEVEAVGAQDAVGLLLGHALAFCTALVEGGDEVAEDRERR